MQMRYHNTAHQIQDFPATKQHNPRSKHRGARAALRWAGANLVDSGPCFARYIETRPWLTSRCAIQRHSLGGLLHKCGLGHGLSLRRLNLSNGQVAGQDEHQYEQSHEYESCREVKTCVIVARERNSMRERRGVGARLQEGMSQVRRA